MIRCCLCRAEEPSGERSGLAILLKPTNLPGSGYRCIDLAGCRERVRATIAAHVGLAEVCE